MGEQADPQAQKTAGQQGNLSFTHQGTYVANITLPPVGTVEYLKGFHQEAKGSRIQVSPCGSVVKRIDVKDKCQRGCVVGGDGMVQQYAQGSFWSFAVRAVDKGVLG